MARHIVLVPIPVIIAAVNGEAEALETVVGLYQGYIRTLSTRAIKGRDGSKRICVDESMKSQLEAKLTCSIVTGFSIRHAP